MSVCFSFFFFFNDTATTEIYTLSLHDALPISGVGGVDFISVPGRGWCPIEVNPRYTASMELVERAYGISIFETHAQACAGDLPGFDVATAGPREIGRASCREKV